MHRLASPSFLALAVVLGAAGCGPAPEVESPGATPPAVEPVPAAAADTGRVYERTVAFLGTGTDSVFGAPWLLSVRTGGETVRRRGRGWFLRGDVWDPFYDEQWETPPMRAPWRPLPHGPLRMVVGEGDALEQLSFVDGGRRLDLALDASRAEWTGRRGETFRFLDAGLVLAERRVPGIALDLNRTHQPAEGPSGDWVMLVSGDSLHAVLHTPLHDTALEPAVWRGWVHLDFRDLPVSSLTAEWTALRAFDRARREVPVGWTIGSGDGTVQAVLEARSSILEAGEGEGPLLPVDGWFEVTGTFEVEGATYPVHGLLRHTQRE
ncbi:hypothetical protein WI372_12385 [Gemmatimonadota bacterium DH-20]|uniref:Lipoprotein n=1 Tax=Gaopeijia maritima TaxID=3119007 RepID=A0ABU9EAK5_9BACT